VAGWSYAWIAQLSWDTDSWTAPLDSVRVPPGDDTGRATAAQLTALVGRLGATEQAPLFVHDTGYDPVGLTVDLDGVRAQVLVRIRSDRVFYTDPPERAPGAIGRPRRHGRRFACDDPATWGDPDDRLSVNDDQYGHVEVTAWRCLHPRLGRRGRWRHHPGPLPIVGGTIIRVQVQHLPKHDTRAVKTLWLWHAGAADADLDACWRAYIRRFDIEHTLRFGKHTLGWVTPACAIPPRPTGGPGWSWRPTPSCAWPAGGGRPAAAVGAAPADPAAVALAGAAGVSTPCVRAGVPGQRAETLRALPGPPQGPPVRPRTPLPGHQEDRLTRHHRHQHAPDPSAATSARPPG